MNRNTVWYLSKEEAEKARENIVANPVAYSAGPIREAVSTENEPIWGFEITSWSLD